MRRKIEVRGKGVHRAEMEMRSMRTRTYRHGKHTHTSTQIERVRQGTYTALSRVHPDVVVRDQADSRPLPAPFKHSDTVGLEGRGQNRRESVRKGKVRKAPSIKRSKLKRADNNISSKLIWPTRRRVKGVRAVVSLAIIQQDRYAPTSPKKRELTTDTPPYLLREADVLIRRQPPVRDTLHAVRVLQHADRREVTGKRSKMNAT